MARKISYSQSLMYPPNASLTMPDMGRFQKLESHLLPRPGTLRAKSCEAKFEWNSLSSSPFHPQTVSSSLSKPSSTSSHSPTSRSSLILNEPSIEELEYETSDDRDSLRPQNEAKSDPCRSVSEDDEGDQSTDVPAGFQTTSSHQSQSDSLLFEPWIGVQDLHILSVEITDLQARSIIHLAPSIGHTICRYRAQFQAWEQLGFTSPAILHARALVDQCLLRTLLILEPLWERCLLPLMNLKHDLQSLEDHLGSTASNLMPEKEPLGWVCLRSDDQEPVSRVVLNLISHVQILGSALQDHGLCDRARRRIGRSLATSPRSLHLGWSSPHPCLCSTLGILQHLLSFSISRQ